MKYLIFLILLTSQVTLAAERIRYQAYCKQDSEILSLEVWNAADETYQFRNLKYSSGGSSTNLTALDSTMVPEASPSIFAPFISLSANLEQGGYLEVAPIQGNFKITFRQNAERPYQHFLCSMAVPKPGVIISN